MDLLTKRSLYPRVSEIISKISSSEFKSVPIDMLVQASVRGTIVHKYCTTYIKKLWVMDIDPQYSPYFEAFKEWASENIEDVILTEVRLYDDDMCFCGEPDAIVKLKNSEKIALLDIKTSANKSKTWPIQLAAYEHLCQLNGYKIDQVFNIHLKKKKCAVFEQINGEKVQVSPAVVKACKLEMGIEYEDNSKYWEIFNSGLKCYDYFDRKEEV